MKTLLYFLVIGAAALNASAQSKPSPLPAGERLMLVPAGFSRLTPAEAKTLQARKNNIMLELIEARNAERHAAKKAKTARKRDVVQELQEKRLNELRDIEEQLRSGLRPETK